MSKKSKALDGSKALKSETGAPAPAGENPETGTGAPAPAGENNSYAFRSPFKLVQPTFNETPTNGMVQFDALFNPDGDTEQDMLKRSFASIYDYLDARKTNNRDKASAMEYLKSRVVDLFNLTKEIDQHFVLAEG